MAEPGGVFSLKGGQKAAASAAVPFRLGGLQLLQQDLEPIQLAGDLRLQVHRQAPAVTCPQVLQALTPTLRSGS